MKHFIGLAAFPVLISTIWRFKILFAILLPFNISLQKYKANPTIQKYPKLPFKIFSVYSYEWEILFEFKNPEINPGKPKIKITKVINIWSKNIAANLFVILIFLLLYKFITQIFKICKFSFCLGTWHTQKQT